MMNRFPPKPNEVGTRLLANVDELNITASKSDDGMIVRFKLYGGVSFDLDADDEKEALAFVREILDSFESS